MALGDLNHDSLTDVMVANRTSIFIYFTKADGTLQTIPQVITKTGMTDIARIAIGDLTKDGRDDVAVSYKTSVGDPMISIFNQSNNFALLVDILLAIPNPHQMIIGQLDNTATNEIAVICEGDDLGSNPSLVMYKAPFVGPTNRVTITLPDHQNAQLLSAGHIDGDGLLDLIVGDLGGSLVTLLRQPSPSSALTAAWGWGTIAVGGSIADMQMIDDTGSGIARDLAIANSAYDRVEFRDNTGTTIPSTANSSRTVYYTTDISSFDFGSLTGSASLDLVAISSSITDCRMYPRQSGLLDDTIYQRFPVNNNPLRTCVIDSETVLKGAYILSSGGAESPSRLEFYEYDGNTVGNADGSIFENYVSSSVAAGNVSIPIIASVVQGQNIVQISDLTGTSIIAMSTQGGPCGLCISDLNGDGVGDLAVINKDSGTVSLYLGGPDFMTKTSPDVNISLTSGSPLSITCGWLQSAGMEVLVIGCTNGVEVIYDALGSAVHEVVGATTIGDRAVVTLGNFGPTGTGGDIAVLNLTTRHIDIYYQSTTGSAGNCFSDLPSAWLNMTALSPISMACGDFDGDGLDDVAVTSSSGPVYLFNNSIGGFYIDTPDSSLFALTNVGRQVLSADLNDDGLSDLAISYSGRPEIALFLSKGETGFINPINVTAGGISSGAYAGDVNGDSRDDVLASSSSASFVSYWLQQNLLPVAEAWISSTSIVEGTNIRFDASNSTDSKSDRTALQDHVYWYFEPGRTSTLAVGEHKYAKSGTYDGYLLVTDRNGSTDQLTFTIVVIDISPMASFAFEPDNGLENTTVWFNDTSAHYDNIAWRWDFGDGNYSTAQNTTHKYLQNGIYHVWLNVTDTDGKWDNATMEVHVGDRSPIAGIWASASNINENGTVSFRDASSSEPDPIISYVWDFDDNDPISVGKEVAHRFPVKGSYNVTLTIIDSDGDVTTANVIIIVQDIPPVASFTPPKTSPLEGEIITLTDTSYSYDRIASWRWDLGDERILTSRNVTISYQDSGSYIVNLTVTDLDGIASSYLCTITVQPTSPTLGPISANGGKTSFTMDEEISIEVTGQQALVPIVRYAWDFDYNATEGFVETPGISMNQTTWSYHQPGEYVVCVRAYDSNSYTERLLTIAVQNMRPVASVTSQASGPSNYSFDASLSWDTNSDNSSLQFRWNFADNDGWTAWSSSKNAWKNYTTDGRFSVIMEVRDHWGLVGSATTYVLVDNGPPTLDLDTNTVLTKAYRGDELVVRVNVTDVSTIAQVVLYYESDNTTYSMAMSRIAGTDTYVATIPALNFTGPLTFHIEADDVGGHRSISTPMSVSVLERPSDDWIYVLAMCLATILAILFFYFRALKMVVDEVFFIYEDGNLIAHQTRRLKPGMDDQILGSMLVAIQNFVRDSFKDEASTGLNRMDFGEKKVLVEKGDHIYLAVVLHGTREGKVPRRMRATIFQAEADFRDVLNDWDGDLDKFRGIKDRAGSLLKGSVMDVLPSHGQEAEVPLDEKVSEAEMIECPVCDVKVGLDSTKCPNCGAALAMAGIGEFADMVDELKNDDRSGQA